MNNKKSNVGVNGVKKGLQKFKVSGGSKRAKSSAKKLDFRCGTPDRGGKKYEQKDYQTYLSTLSQHVKTDSDGKLPQSSGPLNEEFYPVGLNKNDSNFSIQSKNPCKRSRSQNKTKLRFKPGAFSNKHQVSESLKKNSENFQYDWKTEVKQISSSRLAKPQVKSIPDDPPSNQTALRNKFMEQPAVALLPWQKFMHELIKK